MTAARTLATYALAFYLGATVALLTPFASPLADPLFALARILAGR